MDLGAQMKKLKVLTRCPTQNVDYDTEEEASTTDQHKGCLVVSYDMLENGKKFSPFFPGIDLKLFTGNVYFSS